MVAIDLNADLGEGYGQWSMGDDEGLLRTVSSANVACGFHAGDPRIMARVCQLAADNGVTIGAHIGFQDLYGFGRRPLPTSPEDLHVEALYQIGALTAFAERAGTRVRYVKPHGALYHAASGSRDIAEAVVTAMRTIDTTLTLLGLKGSHAEAAALQANIRFASEGFADRAYNNNGTLLARSEPGAVLHDIEQIVSQVQDISLRQQVTTTTGARIDVQADSICLHGDNPGARHTAQRIATELTYSGVEILPFATAP